jgi:hypothetical protein
MKRLVCVALVTTAMVVAAPLFGNPPPPPERPKPVPPPVAAAPINVLIDDKATETKLLVPRKILATLKADAGEAMDPETGRASLPSWHLLIAGSALAAAVAVGGLWFILGRKRSNTLALVLGLTGVGIAAGIAWANVAPPPPRPPIPVIGIPLADKAKVEVVEEGDAIVLVATREQLTKLLEKAPAPK